MKMANDVLSLPAQIEMLKDLVDLESKIQRCSARRNGWTLMVAGRGLRNCWRSWAGEVREVE